jgi:hypothetical protein
MTTRTRSIALLALAALSVAALAVQAGLNVKRQAKEGQTIKYKLEGDIDFQGTPVGLSATVTQKVTKVEPSGNYTLEESQSDAKLVVNGAEQEMPSDGTATSTYKPSGEIVEVKGAAGEPEKANRMANLGIMFDSGKDIKVGDKWTYDIKADSAKGTVAGKAEYEFVSEEKVGNYDTMKIHATIKETEGTDPASATGYEWINKADGSLVKSESEWKNAPIPGAPGLINAKMKMTRID